MGTYIVMCGDAIVSRFDAPNALVAGDRVKRLCRDRCYFEVEIFALVRGGPYFAARDDDYLDQVMREAGYGNES